MRILNWQLSAPQPLAGEIAALQGRAAHIN